MRRLPTPVHKARFVFTRCAESIRNVDQKKNLLSVAGVIEIAETNYKEHAANGTLFTIAEATKVADSVTSAEMVSLYKNVFSRKDSKARYIYDAIKVATRICPFCGHRRVATLDHYLAKTRHPAFAVTPVNLVPSCYDCNVAKNTWQPVHASEQIIHPYFDNIDDEVWLIANLQESTPPALVFDVASPATWDDVKRDRVLNHFRALGLGLLYSTYAAVELVNIRHYLIRIGSHQGANGVRDYLTEQAESRSAAAKNSWEFATYEAVRKSEWFCQGGYKDIATLGATA